MSGDDGRVRGEPQQPSRETVRTASARMERAIEPADGLGDRVDLGKPAPPPKGELAAPPAPAAAEPMAAAGNVVAAMMRETLRTSNTDLHHRGLPTLAERVAREGVEAQLRRKALAKRPRARPRPARPRK
ncbi:MAG TPA: hypothetical protein VGB90_09580 [Alphaproteobacteria bacterium]|jgi:hypothetical protein